MHYFEMAGIKHLLFSFALSYFVVSSSASQMQREDPPIFEGFIDVEGKQYYLDVDKFTWYDAQIICQGLNMTSIVIETQEEEDKIGAWFAQNTDFSELPIWTGGNRKAFDDRWFWATTGADITEFHWAESYPQHDSSQHGCISFTVPAHGWQDHLCETTDAYLPGIMCE